jgi:putative two-component system response regulator
MKDDPTSIAINSILMESRDKVLLIVDDEPNIIASIKRSLNSEKMEVLSAASGKQGIDVLKSCPVGVVLSDQMMPEMDGISFLSKVREFDPDIVRLLLTGYASVDSAMDAIRRCQIFEYLTKPWDPDALKGTLQRAFRHHFLIKENHRLQSLTVAQNHQLRQMNDTLDLRVKDRTRQLDAAVREGVMMLCLAAEAKDRITGDHVQRIQELTRRTCLRLGMSAAESDQLGFSSIMHDVGKIHIPDHILNKKGSLTQEERLIMQQHTIVGEKILGKSPYYSVARQIARSHHECVDGSGYPDGLKDSEIPLAAKIVAVADVFDALTNERPYKKAWSVPAALEELGRLAGRQFNKEIVDAFVTVVSNGNDQGME